mmetsp:Transcript_26817/g.37757  ORF Transcript_26817/g.37757 Transcript_26817/m.37757 type:complete len:329 (-) Transcript_26817:68-1054(-)
MALQWLRESRTIPEEQYCVLFNGPTTSTIAEELEKEYPDYIKRGEITWGKFEDGFPNLFIKNVDSIRGRDVVLLVSFLDQQEMLSQLSVMYSLPRYMIRSLIIVLPYFPTGTMERVDEEGQIATAMTFARLLSATPITITGPAKLIIYDIHALQNRFYFGDTILPLLTSAIPLFQDALKQNHANEKIVIAFPDDGAAKRFGNFFKELNVVTCLKVREGNKRIVKIKEGEEYLKDAHVFIVDDLVKTGGTLIECKQVLLQHGAAKVSAYVSHAVFPQESWKRFIKESPDQFSCFYTTDSCPEVTNIIKDQKPFRVLKLAKNLGEVILKY